MKLEGFKQGEKYKIAEPQMIQRHSLQDGFPQRAVAAGGGSIENTSDF